MHIQNNPIQDKPNFNSAPLQAYSGYDADKIRQENNSMAFVNEKIPEAEKEKFTFPVVTDPDGFKPTLWKWTIDREQEAFLVFTRSEGGGYEGTQLTWHCVLNWKGELIHFAADPILGGHVDAGQIMVWRVYHVQIPSTLQSKREAVLQLIREALDAVGYVYDREHYVAVNITFDRPAFR